MRKRNLVLAAATVGVAVFIAVPQAKATSYASGVTVTGSTVKFDLNEGVNGSVPTSTAGDVKLFYNGTSQDLGALPAGMQSVTLGATPTTPVQVEVTTNDGNGFLSAGSQTLDSSPASTALEIDPNYIANGATTGDVFGSPKGIAVVTDPTSPEFGRIYVANSATNTTASVPQIGIYALNPDFTFVGAYPTEAAAAAANSTVTNVAAAAGLTFGGSSDPWRMSIGSDGYLYITSEKDATGGIQRAQITASGLANGADVFSAQGISSVNHGDIWSEAVVHGSTASGDLTVTAIDAYFGGGSYLNEGTPSTDTQQIFQWNVGATTGYAGAPTKVLNVSTGYQITDPSGGQTYIPLDTRFWSPENLWTASGDTSSAHWYNDFGGVDFDLAQGGPANQFYVAQSRSKGNQPDLFVLSPDGSSIIWDSLDLTARQGLGTADFLLGVNSEAVSPDGRFLMLGQSGGAAVDFGGYVVPLLAGMPDVRLTMPFNAETAGYTYRQPAFDAAGNVYSTATYSGSLPAVGEYGPGGTTVTVTGSNGTFTATGQWTADANGSLSNASNWLVGNVPNGTNQVLTFGSTTTAQRTVSVDTNVTEGAIVFSSPKGYVLSAGGGSITLSGMGANLTANAGNNTISAPVNVNTDLGLFAASGASLTISGPITYTKSISYINNNLQSFTNGTPDIVKSGAGTVSVSNLNLLQNNLGDASSGNLDIYEGKLVLLKNSGPAVVSELTVYNQYGASLDLTNNDLIDDYNLNAYTTTSPLAAIQGLVASGGITSSMAGVANGTGLAVVENNSTYFPGNISNDSPFSTFDGQTVDTPSSTGGTVIVKYTYFGDLNLDGKVDGTDLTLMGYYGNTTTLGWVAGDLNYDGKVNADDYALFQLGLAQYNKNGAIVAAPEPATLSLLGLAAIPMLRRRRA
ncbi:MAG TPA: dockerin type I domain-containing protein [Tepidisphaeraceae bacterium]|jgi:hypothetical protein